MRPFAALLLVCTTVYSQVPQASREQALGREMARDVERRERFVEDPQVVDYVSAVVRKLATPCNSAGTSIRVIDSESVNGSILPGGQMYVTSGLLRFVENESELAGVLAHLMRRTPLSNSAQASSAPGIPPPAVVFVGGPNGDSFLPTPDAVIPRAMETKVDDAIVQADEKAMRCMDAAGYDPVGLIFVLQRLPKIPVDRMEHVAETIMKLEPSNAFLTNTPKFQELHRRLVPAQTARRVPSLRN